MLRSAGANLVFALNQTATLSLTFAFFFFNNPATPEIYPLPLHDALPIFADADRLQMVRLEDEGFTPAVIYPSHIDAGAYFSPTDRRQALMNDEPMYPETTYVVVSVVESRVAAVGAFRWSPDARDFVPIDVKPEEART